MQKTGYKVEWVLDGVGFDNVIKDIVVTVKETPKTYTITLNTKGGTLSKTTITVVYGEAYTLPKPTHRLYTLVNWMYKNKALPLEGVWDIDEEDGTIELVAQWEIYTGEY